MTEKQAKRCVDRILNKLFDIPGVEIVIRGQYAEDYEYYRFEEDLAKTLKDEYES